MTAADHYLQAAVDELIEPALEELLRGHEAMVEAAPLVKSAFLKGRARPFKTQIVDSKLYVAIELPSGPYLFQSQRAQEMLRWVTDRRGPELSPLEKAGMVPPALRERARDFVAVAAVELLRTIFTASDLKGAALSLYEARTPKRLGHTFALTCLLAVHVDREDWNRTLASAPGAGPEQVLRSFKLDFAYDEDFSVRASKPALPPGHEHRLSLRHAPLWQVQLDELEGLTCELLTRMGFQVRTVTRTRDNGVDLYAVAPPPTAKQRFVVQVKSYLTNVGAPAVRELRERIKPPRVTGAILITTSGFSDDAVKAARARPLQLINGAGLRHLLLDYGLRWTTSPAARL